MKARDRRTEAQRHSAIRGAGQAMSDLSNKDWIDVIVVSLIERIGSMEIEDLRRLESHFGQSADEEERSR